METQPSTDARGWVTALCVLGVLCAAATLWIARDRDCLRTPDEAAYAEQAQAILAGGELTNGFVRHFHVRYPESIDHPEDFYPPGNGALLALSWAAFGRSDFTSTIPSILIACLLLPLLAFILARQIGASPPFAFGCGVSIMLADLVRLHAFQGLADLPLCAAVLAALVLALRGGFASAAAAGVMLALGFYFKPTALLFIPGLALVWPLAARLSLRQWSLRVLLFSAVFLCAIAPWLLRNYLLFGDPLYSGNKHLTAVANSPTFRFQGIRKVYWADPEFDLPSMAGSLFQYGLKPVLSRFVLHVYQCVIEFGPTAFGFWFVIGALTLFGARRVRALLVFMVTFVLALSAVFAIELRYLMPIMPLSAAIAWTCGDRIVRQLGPGGVFDGPVFQALARAAARLSPARRVPALPALAAIVLVGVTCIPAAGVLARDLCLGKIDFCAEGDWSIRDAARWVAERVPEDAHVMNQEALRFRYYSGRRTVDTPFDWPDRIQAVVDAYRVDYIVTNMYGNYSAASNRHLDNYFKSRRGQWSRVDPPGTTFTVWVRDGAPVPR